jgi:hypothetical protein
MENVMRDKIFETLAVDENGQDVYGKVQTILLKKLVATKMQFPFMKEIDTKIREAAGNTADFLDKNEIPDETQFKWLRLIEFLPSNFLLIISDEKSNFVVPTPETPDMNFSPSI